MVSADDYTWGDECEAKAQSEIVYHHEVVQGSDEWLQQRCGMLTASEVHYLVTPTLKVADNERTRLHVYELLAQRITGHVEPRYVSDDMLRGKDDELEARMLYSQQYAEVKECGFVTRAFDYGTIGCSPDGLVGDDGMIEVKSRLQKYQVQTFLEWHNKRVTPADYMLQVQTGLYVTQRKWCDLISYSGGLPLCVMRVLPDDKTQRAIEAAHQNLEATVAKLETQYLAAVHGLRPTKRRVVQEMILGGEQ